MSLSLGEVGKGLCEWLGSLCGKGETEFERKKGRGFALISRSIASVTRENNGHPIAPKRKGGKRHFGKEEKKKTCAR